ncbi:MAG: hypothetical protein EHM37_23275 [Deltaproteobacteria bacterium]|nr:MAG: hypothetical protein EHM37_23275 [Deltaproteobacteria bacterium]
MKRHTTTHRQLMQRGLKIPLFKEIYQWSESLELHLTRQEAEKLAGVCMERHSHPHGGRLCH